MTYLGMCCLGAFVGGVLALGIDYIKTRTTYLQLSVAIIAAALSGTVVGYFDYLARQGSNQGLFTYPIGLLLALLWYYARFGVGYIIRGNPVQRTLGSLHLCAIAIATIAALVLVFPVAYVEVIRAAEIRDKLFYINQYHVLFDGIADKVHCDAKTVRISRSEGEILIDNGALKIAGKDYGPVEPHDQIAVVSGRITVNGGDRRAVDK